MPLQEFLAEARRQAERETRDELLSLQPIDAGRARGRSCLGAVQELSIERAQQNAGTHQRCVPA